MNTLLETKVLIVDDEIDACYLLVNMFSNKKIRSKYANSLQEAEAVLKKEAPSIILLDNHLKDGLGVDFIEHIKKYSPNSKVVIISAQDTAADRNKAYLKGADYFIAKPFTSDLIYRTIGQLNPSIIQ